MFRLILLAVRAGSVPGILLNALFGYRHSSQGGEHNLPKQGPGETLSIANKATSRVST